MNTISRLTTILALILVVPALLCSQEGEKQGHKPRVMKFNAETSMMLDEIGVVVSEEEGKPRIVFVAPEDRRPKEAAGMDIRMGDEVGMANGKPVRTVKELREAYGTTKTDAEFKLGLRRDGGAHILTFKKKEAQQGGERRMVIKGGGDGTESTDILPALGIAIEQKKEGVVITEILPDGPKELSAGDVITALNGKKVKTIVDFSGVYDKTEEGDELNFSVTRGGSEVSYVTKRTMPKGVMKVKVK